MMINIPEFSLVVIIGASGSGKSTFARKHFKATEIVSSDYCRSLISDDESNQPVSTDAFDLVYTIIRKRLAWKKLTVVDATNVHKDARKPLLSLAMEYKAAPVAIVLNMPQSLCVDNNQQRPNRQVEHNVINNQLQDLNLYLNDLKNEGFQYVYFLNSKEEVDGTEVERSIS